MRIISLHVDGFGKLVGYDCDFTPGMNCICEENGSGKTTLAAFIKAMLYGLERSTKRDVSENEFKHYTPWDKSASFGGTLDLETDKGRFRLARSFDSREFSLTDLDTGLASNAYSENIGVELFGIDAGGLEKSVFVPQYDVVLKNTDDLTAKLTGLVESSDDVASYADADKRLTEYRKNIKHLRGEGGLKYDAERQRKSVLRELEICRNDENQVAGLRDEFDSLDLNIAEAKRELVELNAQRSAAAEATRKYGEYNDFISLRNEAVKAEEALRELEKLPIPKDEEEAAAKKLLSELKIESGKEIRILSSLERDSLDGYKKRFGAPDRADDELEALKKELASIKAEKDSLTETVIGEPAKPGFAVSAILAIAGLAAAVVGAILLSVATAFGTVLLAGGIVTAIFGIVSAVLKNKKYRSSLASADEAKKDLQDRTEKVGLRENALREKYGFDPERALSDDIKKFKILCADEKKEIDGEREKQDKLARLTDILNEFFAGFDVDVTDDYDEAFGLIAARKNELSLAAHDCKTRLETAVKYAKEHGIDPAAPAPEPPVCPDDAEIQAVSDKIQSLENRKGQIGAKIDSLLLSVEKIPELTEKSSLLKEEIAIYEKKLNIADRTLEFLKNARNSLSTRYLSDMTESFSARYAALSGREGLKLGLGADFAVKIRECGSDRAPEWYSEGMKAVIGICLRLALCDSLFKNEKPFMILDDPFSELDGDRFAAASDAVKTLSADRQIIYFTCHESRII